jgi:DNA polymerase III subunit gamma/tau
LQTVLAALQVLAEARGRMARVTFERPVAELALVRMALLEDLQEIGRLVEELRNGQLSGGGTPPARSAGKPARSPAPRATEPEPAPAQKKSAAESSISAKAPLSAEPDAAVTPAPSGGNGREIPADGEPVASHVSGASPAFDLTAGREPEFWTQVLYRVDDAVRDKAKVAASLAISGPNGLDVLFPASYHFGKQYCERPEVLARLERAAAEVAGRPIRIRISVEAGPAETVDQSTQRPPQRAVPEKPDDFVEEALAVFGATVVKVEPLAATATAAR